MKRRSFFNLLFGGVATVIAAPKELIASALTPKPKLVPKLPGGRSRWFDYLNRKELLQNGHIGHIWSASIHVSEKPLINDLHTGRRIPTS